MDEIQKYKTMKLVNRKSNHKFLSHRFFNVLPINKNIALIFNIFFIYNWRFSTILFQFQAMLVLHEVIVKYIYRHLQFLKMRKHCK